MAIKMANDKVQSIIEEIGNRFFPSSFLSSHMRSKAHSRASGRRSPKSMNFPSFILATSGPGTPKSPDMGSTRVGASLAAGWGVASPLLLSAWLRTPPVLAQRQPGKWHRHWEAAPLYHLQKPPQGWGGQLGECQTWWKRPTARRGPLAGPLTRCRRRCLHQQRQNPVGGRHISPAHPPNDQELRAP